MPERLQKIIAARGIMSRRAAETYIADGRVTVNGVTAKLGDTAGQNDIVLIDGKALAAEPEKTYIMLNKPRGVVTTMADEKKRPTVADLVKGAGSRVLPVGRLDMDSEGLLLMTNDNGLINCLTHPSYGIEKEYRVWVRGYNENSLFSLSQPMEIDGIRIHPAKARLVSCSGISAVLSIVINEGRKHQVRKMCANIGLSVDRLMRVREGDIHLSDLKKGTWRYLTAKEINMLKG